MIQEVYIDLYFLINVSMDLLCLMITAFLLHRSVKRRRACLAALIGGGYAVLSLLLSLNGLLGFLSDIAAAVVMCAVSFWERKASFFGMLQCALVQSLVSMMLGGIMTALYSLLNRLNLPFDALKGDGLSVWSFALLTAVASIATVRGGRLFGLSQKTKSVTLHIVLFKKEVTLQAMVDSGNLLRDPISGKSVIVAELSALSQKLPGALLAAYESNDFGAWLSVYENAKYIRPIPTHTAAGDALLFAIVPDSVTVACQGKTYSADYLIAPTQLACSTQGFDAVIALG